MSPARVRRSDSVLFMDRFQYKPYLFFLLAAELMICITLIVTFFTFTPDDGFIYLYGARQLAQGQIPNYTPGENPTNAFGSPLWLLMLAPSYLLSLSPLVWAKIAGLLLLLGAAYITGLIVLALVDGLEKRLAFAASGSMLCLPFMVACALNTLDTLLAVFSLMLALYCVIKLIQARGGYARTGGAIGLMLISRPDAFLSASILLLAVLFALSRDGRERRRKAIALILGMLPGLLLLAGTMIAFGEIMPNSAAAKSPGLSDLFSLSIYRNAFFTWLRDFSKDSILYLLYVSLIPFCMLIKDRLLAVLFVALTLVHLGVFLLAQDWMGLHRLYLPSIAVALAAFLVVTASAFERKERLVIPLAILVLMAPMSYSHWKTFAGYNYSIPGSPAERMGRFIAAQKLPDSYLMTGDMGVVPYYGAIPTIDSNDTPICNKWRRTHIDDVEYIFSRNVDFIIMINACADGRGTPVFSINEKIFAGGYFQENYVRIGVATWRSAIEGHREREFAIGYGRYFHLYVSKRIADRLSDKRFIVF